MVDKDKSLDKYYCDGKINLYEAIDLLDVKYKNVVIFKCYFVFIRINKFNTRNT